MSQRTDTTILQIQIPVINNTSEMFTENLEYSNT